MSAIAGIFYRDGRKVNPKLIKKMNDKLSHRGPDGSAIWCEGPVALGHQMLWTTPESLHEKLPFHEENAGLVITADARIDNRKELSEELHIDDKEDISDSYFILKSYEKWGEKCPEYLLGDFAFAIWDKNEEKLFCARDHMGVKPFYYYLDDNVFVFGTEIKALLCIDEVPRELNELKIAFHLMRTPYDKLYTFYENILSLTAAHLIEIEKINNKIIKYWKLNPNSEIILDSDEEYVATYRHIFTEAVQCRLRSKFQIGFELSGGLDSSSVVCMAKNILSAKNHVDINTFSIIFDEFPEVDESKYIKIISDNGGIKPNLLLGDEISPLEQIKTLLWYQEQPFYTPNMTLLWNNYYKMNKTGMRVILDGNGGDEVLYHNKNYLYELAVKLKWIKLVKEIQCYSKRTNDKKYLLLLYHCIFPLIPNFLKNSFKRLIPFLKKNLYTYEYFTLNKEFAKRLGGEKHLKETAGVSIKIKQNFNTNRKHHYYILDKGSHQNGLETQDKIASAFSIEVRHPFFDKRLVEFCYAIPDEMKVRYGWDRYLQRLAMENILPSEIQWRSQKKHFTPILEKNLLLLEKENLKKYIFNKNEKIKDYIDLELIKYIYQKYNSGSPGNHSILLWTILILSIWINDNFQSEIYD